jgi:MHS family alpha-ketoglutarate permease-like MFS transporter
MYVAIYMIVIVALCLIVYFTLPETGSRAPREIVSATDTIAVAMSENSSTAASSAPEQYKDSRS